jgi:hypothetical protein
MTKMTFRQALAICAVAAALPAAAVAQGKDPKLVTCAELMAMQEEERMQMLQALVAASADALELNDLVTGTTAIGPIIDVCTANPEMLVMDAAMGMKR